VTTPIKTIELEVHRIIPAPRAEVFEAWMDPKVPGTPWNAAERFLLDAKIDGLFYWILKGIAHYGRIIALDRPACIQYTWMSPNTLGFESLVTVTFEPRTEGTSMTLVHSGLPDTAAARGHEPGWNYFVGVFAEQFGNGSRAPYRWEEAHPKERP